MTSFRRSALQMADRFLVEAAEIIAPVAHNLPSSLVGDYIAFSRECAMFVSRISMWQLTFCFECPECF